MSYGSMVGCCGCDGMQGVHECSRGWIDVLPRQEPRYYPDPDQRLSLVSLFCLSFVKGETPADDVSVYE